MHGLRKKDLNVVGDLLKVDVKEVRKHGKRQAPVWIKLVRPGVDDILDAWQVAGGSEDRVFPCSKWLAWKLISLVSERRLYPHYFRYNRASRFAENPETSLKELKDWFAWSDIKTAGSYMLKSGRTTKKMADRL